MAVDQRVAEWSEAGYRVNDYCRHYFADGAITQPGMSMEETKDA